MAIKESTPRADIKQFWSEFAREAAVSYHVGEHPCIAKFVGVCNHEEHPSLLFIYKSGGNVENVLVKKTKEYWSDKKEDVKKVMEMALQAAQGIAHLHEKKVIHGDIACRNMLLDQHDNLRYVYLFFSSLLYFCFICCVHLLCSFVLFVFFYLFYFFICFIFLFVYFFICLFFYIDNFSLTDFGLSKMVEDIKKGTMATYYPDDESAPETVKYGVVNEKTDVFMFGCTLFVMFSRENLYDWMKLKGKKIKQIKKNK